MKILFNTYQTAFQVPGGGEQIILKSKEYLEKKGVLVTLFDPWTTKVEDFDIIHHFSTIDHNIIKFYKEKNKKIVLTPTIWPNDSAIYKLKYRTKESLKSLVNKSYYSLIHALKDVDLILPTTTLERDRIINLYGTNENKFKVINNGVDLPISSNINFVKGQFNIDDYFLFIGNISPVKNLDYLIEVFSNTEENLVIIGQPKVGDEEYYKTLRNKASKNVHFADPVLDWENINSSYQHAKACIVPSLFETCSLVGLEAGIRDCPVIITQSGGTKEVYKDYVTYIDPNDPNDLKNKIFNFKNKPFGSFIKENYSWEKISQDLLNVYNLLK